MLAKILSLGFFLLLLIGSPIKTYTKSYDTNGALTAEGWMMGTMKVKYWKFYHPNGNKAMEGHFKGNKETGYWYFYNEQGGKIREGHYRAGIAQDWWIFYDLATQETRKVQYQNNQRNGFCLVYRKGKLLKVEKYLNNTFQSEWTDVRSFKKDNPNVSLR